MNRIIRNGSNKNKAALIATGILVLAGWILVFLAYWVFTTWPGLRMDELIFQLKAPLEGEFRFETSGRIDGPSAGALTTAGLLALAAVPRRWRPLLSVPLVAGYVLLTGARPSESRFAFTLSI